MFANYIRNDSFYLISNSQSAITRMGNSPENIAFLANVESADNIMPCNIQIE
jgi:hypothetical protein